MLPYAVFLPRNKVTFDWLERHCADEWNFEEDLIMDYELVYVSFGSLEEAEMAYSCLQLGGSCGVH